MADTNTTIIRTRCESIATGVSGTGDTAPDDTLTMTAPYIQRGYDPAEEEFSMIALPVATPYMRIHGTRFQFANQRPAIIHCTLNVVLDATRQQRLNNIDNLMHGLWSAWRVAASWLPALGPTGIDWFEPAVEIVGDRLHVAVEIFLYFPTTF